MPKNRSFYVFTAVLLLVVSLVSSRAAIDHSRQKDLTACKTNIRNIGTALEMYSTDWSGRYPADLKRLVPKYLEELPMCPAAGESTYTMEGSESPRNVNEFRDYYYLSCQGDHHVAVGVPENFPAFDSAGEPESSHLRRR